MHTSGMTKHAPATFRTTGLGTVKAAAVAAMRTLGDAVERIMVWRERAWQRHALLGLNDHLLKDIGVSRAEAEHEAAKPFWRE